MRPFLRFLVVALCSSGAALAQSDRPQMEDRDDNIAPSRKTPWTFATHATLGGSWSFIDDYPGNMLGLYGGSVYVVVNDTPRVMVFGGYNDSTTTYLNDVWSWNTITHTWTQKTGMPEDRYYHHVAAARGKVYIISGAAFAGSGAPTDTTWEYDPVADSYTMKSPCPAPRNWGGIGVYQDSYIYLVGGSSTGTATYINDVWIYDVEFDVWVQCTNNGTVFSPRRSASVSVVNGPDSSFIVVAGGFGTAPTFKPDAFEAKIDPLDPLTFNWVQIPDIPAEGLPGGVFNGVSRCAGATYGPNHLVIGGQLSFTPTDTVYRYSKQVYAWNTVTKTWSRWADKNWGSSNMMYDAASPTGELWHIGTYGTPSGGIDVTATGTRVSEYLSPASVGVGQDVANGPDRFNLDQNYPNPFNPATTISFTVPERTYARLAVYDVLGRQVSVLTDQIVEAGAHKVVFDASQLASGMYFYRLNAGAFVSTHSMVLLR